MGVIKIDNSSIITGTTAVGLFLPTEINDKMIGIPLYTFSFSSPSLDFIELIHSDVDLKESTLYNDATTYGAGVSIMVNNSAYAIPIYKVTQDRVYNTIEFNTPTLVANLSTTGEFLAVKVNGIGYGIPLCTYSTQFPFTSTVAMSSIQVTTMINEKVKDVSTVQPSTNLNNKVKTYRNLIDRVKGILGSPMINLEVCEDTQMVDFIDQSLEWYTKYAGFTEEFLIFDSNLYKEPGLRIDKLYTITYTMRETMMNGASGGWDYDMGDYRKVVGVFSYQQGETTGINTLFTLEQSMAQQTYFSYMLGNAGFDLVTWECLKGWLDLREKVLAQVTYVDFDNRNQLLRLIPPPNEKSKYYGVIGAWVEKPVKDLIMERWVYQYTLALTMIAIGNIRGKYMGVSLFGGGQINYNDMLSKGLEMKDKLEEELKTEYGESQPAKFFIG